MIHGANQNSAVNQLVDLLVAGPKGMAFLAGVLNKGVNVRRVTSYRQSGDNENSFDSIQNMCLLHSVDFAVGTRPAIDHSKLAFVVGWQYLLQEEDGIAVVFHDSILPLYRGFTPTVTALICGDKRIGVSALRLSATVDGGPIIAQKSVEIRYPIKIRDALRLQVDLMIDMAVDILRYSIDLEGKSQNEEEATLSVWRDSEDYWIDWSESAERISRFIDALGPPYAGACTRYGENVIRIMEATPLRTQQFAIRQPGKFWSIDDGRPTVICGTGALRIDQAVDGSGVVFFDRLRTRFRSGGHSK